MTYGLNPYYQELVLNGQNGGLTTHGILENDMATYKARQEENKHDYLRHYLLWKEEPSANEVIALLSDEPERNEKYILAALYLQKGDYTSATDVLGNCVVNGTVNNACRVLNILIASKQNNQQCPRFTTQQESDLQAIANDVSQPGYHLARTALGLEEDIYFIPPLDFRSLHVGSYREQNMFVEVQPNPTNGSAYFTYTQPEGSEKVEIEIFDPLGKLIIAKDISSSKGLWEWDTKGLGNGLYLYNFKVDGLNLQSDKVSIVK
ncbi:MAG: T9SS type A sorting domain-containing protein [Flavobacteriales bacterium]|nr:T9SS type A sorting domain-containing protein [Flavobacteriales bacterium]